MHGTLPIAKTYKTPKELELSQEEFDALAWFVEQHDAGNIPDADIRDDGDILSSSARCADPVKPPDAFYMPYIRVETGCGTAGCIFGWIEHRVSHVRISMWPRHIRCLFIEHPDTIKAVHARDATVRVLQGKPAW